MVKRVAAAVFVFVLMGATPAVAQVRFVVSGWGGWTVAEGAKSDKDLFAGNGETYNRVDPSDSGSFGLSFGVTEGSGEYGFMYRRQMGTLQVSGSTTTTIGDMNTDNYHGYFAYNFNPDGNVQFFFNAGAGATHFSPVNFTTVGGVPNTVAGRTEFSATVGAGIKTMFTDQFGLRFGVQWTPIYLTLNPQDSWCDPYWGCYVNKSTYANQVEVYAGVTFRFK